MQEQRGLSLIGVIVTIIVIFLIIVVFLPLLTAPPRELKERVICAQNLKGLGMAMLVYANDYDDNYPQLPGTGPWSKQLGFHYDLEKPDFTGIQSNVPRTISSSWYLLVREADVYPKSFICPASNSKEFGNRNLDKNLVKLWDFGPDPYKHVDYSMHNPYGKFPADASYSAAFAIAADMNPWFTDGDIIKAGDNNTPPQVITITPDWHETERDILRLGNYQFHKDSEEKLGEGQNVLFTDGHASYETRPNVGVKRDNIYTFWSTEENPSEQDRQGGTAPTSRSSENDAKSKEDSFLAI